MFFRSHECTYFGIRFESLPKFSTAPNTLYLLFFPRQLENILRFFPPSDWFQANKLVLHGQ